MENNTQSTAVHPSTRAVAFEGQRQEATGEGLRYYQGRILDELPGAAFAVITLVWVIACFFKLVW